MGVEPTKDRLAAPPGFEVRTPHRGRFPSSICCWRLVTGRAAKRLEPAIVDAAQIASPQRHAMPIEKLKNLDSNFAAVIEPIPKRSGSELPFRRRGREVRYDLCHFGHGAANKKMIRSNFVALHPDGRAT